MLIIWNCFSNMNIIYVFLILFFYKTMVKLLVAALLLFITGDMSAQFYSTGEPPFSIKWHQINTPHFQLIYPVENQKEANKMANLMEFYYPYTTGNMNPKIFKKFPVVLHNSSVISNGYVTLVPRRMELVMSPPQDLYAQDWLSQLALHESRHTAQINMTNRGLTHLMSLITGEIALAAVSAEIPQWFYEGDAVIQETLFSKSGRGRMPGFEMTLRTQILENQVYYSYNKAKLGSFRDYVPDHYVFGFEMTNYARQKYGDDIWPGALVYSGNHSYQIWPFTFYLKSHYGFNKQQLYAKTIDSLKNQYNKNIAKINYTDYSSINHRTGFVYTSYQLPRAAEHGNVVALCSGMNDAGSIVVFDSLGSLIYRKPIGYNTAIKFDVFDHIAVWDELVYDQRWLAQSYSVLKVMDIRTGKQKELTKKTRYYSPAFSSDGLRLAVAETDKLGYSYLTILDAHNGRQISKFFFGDKAVQTPEWVSDENVVVITVDAYGKQMEILDLFSGAHSVIIPTTRYNIAEPVAFKQFILFRSDAMGIENIFAVNIHKSNIIYQVTYSKNGAYNPSLSRDSTKLLFANYGEHGYDIAQVALVPDEWTKAGSSKITTGPPVSEEHYIMDTASMLSYVNKPYNKAGHLLRFHSWLPMYANVDEVMDGEHQIEAEPGFMFFSQNDLSTFTSTLGYSYNHGYHQFMPVIKWKGWYPVFELSGQVGGPKLYTGLTSGTVVPDEPYTEFSIRAYIPLYYQHRSFITYIQPAIEYEWSSVWWYSDHSGLNKGLDFIHGRLHVNRYQRLAPRDIYPKWGQSFYGAYTRTFTDEHQLFGDMVSFQGTQYFPGFFPHNSVMLKEGYQIQHPETYFLPFNRMDFPRGYLSAVSREMFGLSANYHFPFGYPDLSIGPVLYLKRLRANLFFDWSHVVDLRKRTSGGTVSFTGNYRSFGFEALADFHLLRIIFPFTAGFRYGYVKNSSIPFTELLFRMDTSIL
jgi:hypothetical protein